ncbi:arginase 2 mitochondrial [Echinococcus multilocularis]|uniref:Arginase 2 mitochondrial n=1 Tax=Echinococcus multilocularis TaxID=6211 RepID=A0A068Y3F4_ECHMU|nr:arginase 2 mitochondrial [Echinococcus multilocularis]
MVWENAILTIVQILRRLLIGANQLLYIGLRDVDVPELELIKEFNIPHFNMYDVEKLGIESGTEITLKIIMRFCPNCQIHLSFDIDGLDSKCAPSTGTPVPGGLSLEEGKYICRTLGQTGRLKSMVIAEVNTSLGSSEDAKTTVNLALEIIKSALRLD